jgi:hypothetical protein
MPVTADNLGEVFRHHAPTTEQVEHYHAIRQAAMTLAETILRHAPSCADQQAAIRLVREAMMTANAAVALDGKV